MMGIYIITNLLDGRVYIGQSNNIERRLKEHSYGQGKRIPLDIDIKKVGRENFSYEMLEECPLESLNEKEQFWIEHYSKTHVLYNRNKGGDQNSIGENNGRAKLTVEDVINIRRAYDNRERRKEVYEKYKDKITFATFAGVWDGRNWSHIMPEVYTEENKRYYSSQATSGELSTKTNFTNEEVIEIRQRYVKETAKEMWPDYSHKITFSSFQQLLSGASFSNIPIYKKREKRWINL